MRHPSSLALRHCDSWSQTSRSLWDLHYQPPFFRPLDLDLITQPTFPILQWADSGLWDSSASVTTINPIINLFSYIPLYILLVLFLERTQTKTTPSWFSSCPSETSFHGSLSLASSYAPAFKTELEEEDWGSRGNIVSRWLCHSGKLGNLCEPQILDLVSGALGGCLEGSEGSPKRWSTALENEFPEGRDLMTLSVFYSKALHNAWKTVGTQ